MRLTPDGIRYLAMGGGTRQPIPFHLRWLLPAVCRENETAWIVANVAGIAMAGILTGWLAWGAGATEVQAVLAALLIWGLPSVRFSANTPVLADMPGMALALWAAVLWPIEPLAAIAVSVVAGCVSEKAPAVAALVAWQPWLLVGLIAPVVRGLIPDGEVDESDPLYDTMRRPFRAGWKAHRGWWRHWSLVCPWGACLLVLFEPSIQVGAALLFGYALLLVATDTVRLYQTVAPVLAIHAALLVPDLLVPAVVVMHWFNPWAGNGI